MIPTLKKTALILLLVALSFNGIGYYFMHHYVQQQIKKEIKARIKQSAPFEELVTIILSMENASDFKWIESREFNYRGTMYDVVSIEEKQNGVKILHCITDIQETELFKNLRKYVCNAMNSNPQNTRAGSMLSHFLGSLFPPVIYDFHPLILEHRIVLSRYFFSYIITDLKISSPPPKSQE